VVLAVVFANIAWSQTIGPFYLGAVLETGNVNNAASVLVEETPTINGPMSATAITVQRTHGTMSGCTASPSLSVQNLSGSKKLTILLPNNFSVVTQGGGAAFSQGDMIEVLLNPTGRGCVITNPPLRALISVHYVTPQRQAEPFFYNAFASVFGNDQFCSPGCEEFDGSFFNFSNYDFITSSAQVTTLVPGNLQCQNDFGVGIDVGGNFEEVFMPNGLSTIGINQGPLLVLRYNGTVAQAANHFVSPPNDCNGMLLQFNHVGYVVTSTAYKGPYSVSGYGHLDDSNATGTVDMGYFRSLSGDLNVTVQGGGSWGIQDQNSLSNCSSPPVIKLINGSNSAIISSQYYNGLWQPGLSTPISFTIPAGTDTKVQYIGQPGCTFTYNPHGLNIGWSISYVIQ